MTDRTFQLIAIGIYFATMLAIGLRLPTNLRPRGLHARRAQAALCRRAVRRRLRYVRLAVDGPTGAIFVSGLEQGVDRHRFGHRSLLQLEVRRPGLRTYTEIANNSITVPSFFENRLRDTSRLLRITAGVIILLFFTFYVSPAWSPGCSSSPRSAPHLMGMLHSCRGHHLAYTLFGGFLGASLTDVAQGLLMFAALLTVPVTIMSMGGSATHSPPVDAADAAHNALHPDAELHRTSLLSAAASWPSFPPRPGGSAASAAHILVRFGTAIFRRRKGRPPNRHQLDGPQRRGAIVTGLIGVGLLLQVRRTPP